MKIKRRTYDKIFKEKAVQLSYKKGSIIQVENELEISGSLICKWRQQYEKFGIDSFCGKGNGYQRLNSGQQKINELKRKAKQSELNYKILKEGSKYISQGKSMVFNFIENNEKVYSTKKMCRVLGVGELSYYRWKNKIISPTQSRIILLKQEMSSIFIESKERYGSSRITKELQNRGYQITHSTVSRHMIQLGLHKKSIRKFKVTTNSNHNHYIAPNLLNREFNVNKPGIAWVSDITYLQTTKGFLYLTIILDLFDRKIIGWNISNEMSTKMTIIPTWEMAVNNREITNELIFHSDRGTQYASKSFTKLLDSHMIVKRSMSRKGDCFDNAVAESFFSTLKRELIYRNTLFTKKKMKEEIFEFIENWYNKKRIHSTLNYMTIEEFNKMNNQLTLIFYINYERK
ncbi:IS3 family transposase [Flavobacterium sp. N1736]|uniref:IS3 family transposase n=1 Tax=Flavobacterium sp. N1736 TaxID=2986823 RepID=UPI002223FB69|nr:IS3 family transposase [Flavobacterium sp. N1736]